MPIQHVRVQRDGSLRPTRVGDTVQVRGRVSAGTGTLPDSTLIFVQDTTAGVAVRLPPGRTVHEGDRVWVEGIVRHRAGLTRLHALRHERIDVLARSPVPVPLTVSTAASERYEGRLVQVQGQVVANRSNDGGQYLLLTDPMPNADAQIAVFVPERRLRAVPLDPVDVGDRVRITGVLSQHDLSVPHDANYQVLPRTRDDVVSRAAGMDHYQIVILIIVGGALLAGLALLTLRTAVRRRTQQLAESRARFRRLAEATQEGILLHRDDEILDVNRALTEMTGYDRSTLMGRSVEDVLAASTQEFQRDALWRATEATSEGVVVRQDGSTFPAEIDERVVEAADQRVRVVALRDITDRKRREAELVEAKEEAEEMDRLKSSLLNNMSHEFRTPITSILGYAEVILDEPEADHEQFAQHIRRSGNRLSRTLRAVLEMAQLEAGQMDVEKQQGDVGAVVRAAVDEYRALAAEKEVALNVTGKETIPAQTDLTLLQRIVGNLVHNAVKFTDGGEVDISVDTEGTTVVIGVADSGIGISPEKRDVLFEPFKQASEGRTRTHEGMGLGLPLTKRMLDLLGGSIEVDSEKGTGTTVVVTVPAIGEEEEQHSNVEGRRSAASPVET